MEKLPISISNMTLCEKNTALISRGEIAMIRGKNRSEIKEDVEEHRDDAEELRGNVEKLSDDVEELGYTYIPTNALEAGMQNLSRIYHTVNPYCKFCLNLGNLS